MAPQVLYRVIYGTPEPEAWQAEQITIRPAVLHGYRRQRVRNADFPAIVPKPSTAVRGVFITGLTDENVHCLDLFEGSMYERRKVKVKLLKNVRFEDNVPDSNLAKLEVEEVEAETYVWKHPVEALEDKEWDFNHFKKQKMKEWTGQVDSVSPDTKVDEGFTFVDEYCAAVARGGSTSGRGTRGQGNGDRGTADRSVRSRGPAGQGTGGRGAGDRDMGGGGTSVRGTGERDMNEQATGVRGRSGQGTGGRGPDGQGPRLRA